MIPARREREESTVKRVKAHQQNLDDVSVWWRLNVISLCDHVIVCIEYVWRSQVNSKKRRQPLWPRDSSVLNMYDSFKWTVPVMDVTGSIRNFSGVSAMLQTTSDVLRAAPLFEGCFR